MVRFFGSDSRLFSDLGRQLISRLNIKATGINQIEGKIIAFDLRVVSIPGYSRLVFYNCLLLSEYRIKKRGLADIRSAEDCNKLVF